MTRSPALHGFLGALLAVAVSTGATAQSDGGETAAEHQGPSPERIRELPRQEITLADFPCEGFVLDVGGGGEGVIGQLKGRDCVAIDINAQELADAPDGPLKIVMDARDLKFLDGAFGAATVFFTFMYIDRDDHDAVFAELARILAPGGTVRIWDIDFPPRPEPVAKDIAVMRLVIHLPDRDIRTGYGAIWPEAGLGLDHYEQLAGAHGLDVVVREDHGDWFYLELGKPEGAS